jgi:hypothetical protein
VAIVNRVLCTVLALITMVVGLVVAAEIIAAGFERGPWLVPYDRWDRVARTTPWANGDVRMVSAALLAVGVAILAVQIVRRRPSALPLVSGAGGATARLDRRGAERWLAERAREVAGVVDADVGIKRKVATARVRTLGPDTASVERTLHEELGSDLAALALERPLRLKVDVQPRTQTVSGRP